MNLYLLTEKAQGFLDLIKSNAVIKYSGLINGEVHCTRAKISTSG